MKIKWFGHACFLLSSEKGVNVVADPFDETIGCEMPEVEADIVSTSHEHNGHNNINIVRGGPMHVKGSGKINIKGVEITGVAAFHDDCGGTLRGRNNIFKFRIDGLNVCHLGDLGHIPTHDQVREIGEVDVLLTPVGGSQTIDYNGAIEVMRLLKPAVTIPMHYRTSSVGEPTDGVEKFLEGTEVGKSSNCQIQLYKDELPKEPCIMVLCHK